MAYATFPYGLGWDRLLQCWYIFPETHFLFGFHFSVSEQLEPELPDFGCSIDFSKKIRRIAPL